MLIAISILAAVITLEIYFRISPPRAIRDAKEPPPLTESPFLYDEEFGFETAPQGIFHHRDELGNPFSERMNSEGFRSPDLLPEKKTGEIRIAAVGDSVVQGFSVERQYSWVKVLEEKLQSETPENEIALINAGIGGYVSSQIVSRLNRRVLKYRPDLVLLHVGWNDLIFGSLPTWRPRMNLTGFEKAVTRPTTAPTFPQRVKQSILKSSQILNYLRCTRNRRWNRKRQEALVERRQKASGIAFNEKALHVYEENLEAIYQTTRENGSSLALLLPPTILVPELFNDSEIQWKLFVYYANFSLSTREYFEWNERYNDVRKKWASKHPDVLLIDLFSEFSKSPREERLALFTDLAHLTRAGNLKFAECVLTAIAPWLSKRISDLKKGRKKAA